MKPQSKLTYHRLTLSGGKIKGKKREEKDTIELTDGT
jgi:hypothetical protein